MSGLLCVAGALVLLAGVVVASATHSVRDGMYVQAAGATVLGIAGGLVLWSGDAVGSSFAGGFHPELGVDRLSAVFLLTLGIASGPALVFAAGYLDASARGRAVAGLTGLFVGVMALMLCARDVVTFLAAWELMTVVPAAIILVWRNEEQARRGVFVYVAITHLAGAGAWVALLVLADHGALGGDALAASSSSGVLVAVDRLGHEHRRRGARLGGHGQDPGGADDQGDGQQHGRQERGPEIGDLLVRWIGALLCVHHSTSFRLRPT